MATIGLHNWCLHDSQCTVRDNKSCDLAVHVVVYSCPFGLKASIGTLSPMQSGHPCTAMPHPTVHCPHCCKFQVIFWNHDQGKLGGFPLQYMLVHYKLMGAQDFWLLTPVDFFLIAWEFLCMVPWAWFMYILDVETSPQHVYYWHSLPWHTKLTSMESASGPLLSWGQS